MQGISEGCRCGLIMRTRSFLAEGFSGKEQIAHAHVRNQRPAPAVKDDPPCPQGDQFFQTKSRHWSANRWSGKKKTFPSMKFGVEQSLPLQPPLFGQERKRGSVRWVDGQQPEWWQEGLSPAPTWIDHATAHVSANKKRVAARPQPQNAFRPELNYRPRAALNGLAYSRMKAITRP